MSVCLSVCNVDVFWPNGWMDQDATWFGGRPRPRTQCVRWRPVAPSERGTAAPPPFRPMSIVAKRLDGSGYHLIRGGPRPRRQCVRRATSSPKERGITAFHFSVHVYCGQTVAILATAELLFYLSRQLFTCFRPLNATLAILKVELYFSWICTSIGHA